jgi:catechol 2,3-dioxygenase-like lactoylglutathione lyase family enzyme
VLETALYVDDVDRSAAFYERLFGSRVLLDEPGRMRALDVAGRQVLLLFAAGASDRDNPVPGGVVPPHDARGRIHVCFAVPADALGAWEAHLAALGVAVVGRVRAEGGATCLYLRDPDGHLVELATPGLWEGVY